MLFGRLDKLSASLPISHRSVETLTFLEPLGWLARPLAAASTAVKSLHEVTVERGKHGKRV